MANSQAVPTLGDGPSLADPAARRPGAPRDRDLGLQFRDHQAGSGALAAADLRGAAVHVRRPAGGVLLQAPEGPAVEPSRLWDADRGLAVQPALHRHARDDFAGPGLAGDPDPGV